MTITPVFTTAFKKDFKRLEKRGADLRKLHHIISLLLTGAPLEEQYKDHPLRGNFAGTRDCHIEADWVLIYVIIDSELRLIRTGTHSDLFK